MYIINKNYRVVAHRVYEEVTGTHSTAYYPQVKLKSFFGDRYESIGGPCPSEQEAWKKINRYDSDYLDEDQEEEEDYD